MSLSDYVNLKDELNIYLVSNGVKPASFLKLSPWSVCSELRSENEYRENDAVMIENSLKEGVKEDFEGLLEDNLLLYASQGRTQRDNARRADVEIPIFTHQYLYSIAAHPMSFLRLLSADNHFDKGLALGFPLDCVESWTEVIGGVRRDGAYMFDCLEKASLAGMELPSWIGYISFIPRNIDLLNDRVSTTAEKVGRIYQSFVRENNPDLATRVEEDFKAGYES